jgi:hypothetical protein
MRKKKIYIGSAPSNDSGFTLLSRVKTQESNWDIYEDLESSAKWMLFKITSCQPVKHKANYALAYSATERRLTGKDLVALASHRPDLLKAFLDSASLPSLEYFGSSFSESIQDMIASESEAS